MSRRFLIGVALAASLAQATVPQSFSVQGLLRDSAGKLQSVMVTLTLKLFDMDGNLLDTPVAAQQVMAQSGLFTVSVPVSATLLGKLGSTSPVLLEMTVNARRCGADVAYRSLDTTRGSTASGLIVVCAGDDEFDLPHAASNVAPPARPRKPRRE